MTRHRVRRAWGLLLLGCLCTPALGATIYRWADERGVTHFSDSPPAGVRAQAIEVSPPPAEPAPGTDWRKLDEEFRARHAAREKALDEAAQRRKLQAELDAIDGGAGTPVPGETFAQPDFQKKVIGVLVRADQSADPTCADHSVTGTEALGRDEDKQALYERWVLDRCGKRVAYRVTFSPFFRVMQGSGDAPRHALAIVDERSGIGFDLEKDGGG